MRYLWVTLLLLLTACSNRFKPVETHTPVEALQAQYEVYHTLAKRGWDIEETCDALLFVSLGHVGLVEPGPVSDAQSEPGHWFRLPGPGYAEGCSSDISRDMLMGLLVHMWKFRQLELAEQLWSYGASHGWKMGEERLEPNTRTVMSPAQIGLLAEMIHRMGGADHPERIIPALYDTSPGYTSHLTMLHIWLIGQMRGNLGSQEVSALRAILKHMDSNPLPHALLHRYTDGDQTAATRRLLDTWPEGRLPTSDDWCEHWRTQRSDGDTGFDPCSEGLTHSGGDFLFTAAIILGK